MEVIEIKDERAERLETHKRVAKKAKAEGKTRIYEMAIRAIGKLTAELSS